jgi:hypothetical protein
MFIQTVRNKGLIITVMLTSQQNKVMASSTEITVSSFSWQKDMMQALSFILNAYEQYTPSFL